MPAFKVAHVREQGVDLVVVPLDGGFDQKTQADQLAVTEELQMRSMAAGLRGTVVPVWPAGNRMKFIAPQGYHPFFRSVDLNWVGANIKRQISW
jgi:hypothetical protein